MICEKCHQEDFKKIIKIEINLYEEYEKIEELGDINLCVGCFITSLRNSFIDEKLNLEKIIEDATKE